MGNLNPIRTIGHSLHDQNDFLGLLNRYNVSAVADVRSIPSSRAAPQYNRSSFRRFLRDNGVDYVFLGSELGARSDDPRNYDHGKVSYARLAELPPFLAGISRLIAGARTEQIAIMCAEANPLDCHRGILVSPRLTDRGVSVEHIRSDGSLESQTDLMLRLREMHGLLEPDLFSSPSDLERAALERQESRIAYVDPDLVGGGSE